MKGNHWALAATVALLAVAGQASAGPIELQIDGSDLSLVDAFGVGDYTYSDNAFGSITLAEGGSHAFNFGHVDLVDEEHWVCGLGGVEDCVAAIGEIEFSIDLSSPLLDGSLGDIALFGVLSADNAGLLRLEWGAPTSVGYSYGGASGGILSLNMYDIGSGFLDWDSFEDGFDLLGTITNVQSPVAVAEPGVLLLLGGGLLTIAATRRRRASRA